MHVCYAVWRRYVWLPLFINPANKGEVRVVWHPDWALNDTSLYPF